MPIDNILKNLKKIYQQKYGVAVFSVKAKNTKGGVEINGEVLTKNQRDNILNVFKREKVKVKKVELKILSNTSEKNEIGWAIVKMKIANLKLRFVSNKILNSRILKRVRCSQAFRGEVLRILFKKDDQLLVQQNDLTLGWINRNEVILKKGSLYRNLHKKWASGNFALKGRMIKINKIIITKRLHSSAETMEPTTKFRLDLIDKILKEAEIFLGVKYLLGGKSKKGIDCSGLIQMIYKSSFNIILPKHSWDQEKMGRKINLKNIKSGDLIFLIKKSNKHKHVGIVEKNKSVNLIHASLEKKKAIKQKLDEVFESYDFVEARRIIES